jgi:hypothetical protein
MRLLFIVLLLATEPSTPQEWFQLGVTRHDARDYAGALTAFEKSRDLGYSAPILLPLRMSRTYARLGNVEKAFENLKLAVDRGYSASELMNAENDFLKLRDDPRWNELVTTVQRNQHPCRNAAESRQFDFWLGEWDVETNGQKIARSSIQLILDECVIFENYEAPGYSGKSLSTWSSGPKRWEQYYTDTAGGARFWSGALQDGKIVMTTEFDRNGTKVTNRMTYSKEGPDRVRQFIETSTDGGKTWAAAYDGMYVRRK